MHARRLDYLQLFSMTNCIEFFLHLTPSQTEYYPFFVNFTCKRVACKHA